MGIASLFVLLLTRGEVELLVVLYSINVFITFSLSQAGMVRHWWQVRADDPSWFWRLTINAVGFGTECRTAVTACCRDGGPGLHSVGLQPAES